MRHEVNKKLLNLTRMAESSETTTDDKTDVRKEDEGGKTSVEIEEKVAGRHPTVIILGSYIFTSFMDLIKVKLWMARSFITFISGCNKFKMLPT